NAQVTQAKAFLMAHPETQLVSVALGANDLLLVRKDCHNDTLCAGEAAPDTLAELRKNLRTIFNVIRVDAGYKGQLVSLKYYTPDFDDFLAAAVINRMNGVLAEEATRAGAR